MVAAIAALVPATLGASVTVFGIPLVTAAGTLTVAGTLLNAAAGLAIQSALSRKSRLDTPKPNDLQTNSKVTAGERFVTVGQAKFGGNHVFHRATDGVSYRVIVFGQTLSGIARFDLGRQIANVDPYGQVTNLNLLNGAPRVEVHTRLGAVPETAYDQIRAIWPEYTSEHRLDGLASALVISRSVDAQNQNSVFPNGEPEIQIVGRADPILDPRTGERAFSENAALVINDYAERRLGLDYPGFFDPDNISAEADAADALVEVVGGGAEERWRLGAGQYSLSQRPQDVLRDMMKSCGARIRLQGNGKTALRLPRDVDPVLTLTDADIIEETSFRPAPELLERFNEASATYSELDLNYTTTTCQPVVDPEMVARYGGRVRGEVEDLPFTPSNRQAMDVLRAQMARKNPVEIATLLFRLNALEAIGEFEIRMDAPAFGYVGKYEPTAYQLVIDGGFLVAVRLTIQAVSETAYVPTPVTEQGEQRQLPVDSQDASSIPLPVNLQAAGAGQQTASGSFVAGISVAWDAPLSDALTPAIEFRVAESANAELKTVPAGSTRTELTPLVDQALYDVEFWFVDASGNRGPSQIVENVKALASTTAPDAPADLTVQDLGDGLALVEVTASASADNRVTILFRDGVEIHREVSAPGASVSFVDDSGAGTFAWTARALNVSLLASATDAGPQTEIIT